jgi:hypothetical protein
LHLGINTYFVQFGIGKFYRFKLDITGFYYVTVTGYLADVLARIGWYHESGGKKKGNERRG